MNIVLSFGGPVAAGKKAPSLPDRRCEKLKHPKKKKIKRVVAKFKRMFILNLSFVFCSRILQS